MGFKKTTLSLRTHVSRVFVAAFILIFSSHSSALVGGSEASTADARGIVGISYEGEFTNCVGVLLEADKVLTTVTCLDLFSGLVDSENIRVHPLQGLEIGGTGFVPTLNENVTPFVGVSSFVFHPQSAGRIGPYNLAVLTLESDLSIVPALIYGGTQSFIGARATAFGWEDFTRRNGFLNERFYRANLLLLPPLVDGDDDFDSISNGCYDSFEDTDTVFCAGFKNDSSFLESNDTGSPLFVTIDSKTTVIGLLSAASNGFEFDAEFTYEEFARITPMLDFILAQAPNTQLVMDMIVEPPVENMITFPAINLLLLDE